MEEKEAIFNNSYGYFADFVNKLFLANMKKLNNKTLQKSFDIYKVSLLNYYGIPATLINLVKKKEIYSLEVNKKIINSKKLKKSLEWLQYNGVIIEYLKKINIPQKFLENSLVIEKNTIFLQKYEEYTGFHLLTHMKIRMKIAKQINHTVQTNVKTETDLTKVFEKNAWLKIQFDDFLENYYYNSDNKEMGSWTKTVSLTSNNINSLFNSIKNHQNAIKPGCWAIKYDKDSKCLIKDLSCNEPTIESLDHNANLCEFINCKKCCKNQKNCEIVCSNTSGSVLVPPDTVLICIKNSNFWVAAQDYMNVFFDVPEIEVLNDNDDDDNGDDNVNDVNSDSNSLVNTSSNDVLKWIYIGIVMVTLLWMIYLIYLKDRL